MMRVSLRDHESGSQSGQNVGFRVNGLGFRGLVLVVWRFFRGSIMGLGFSGLGSLGVRVRELAML